MNARTAVPDERNQVPPMPSPPKNTRALRLALAAVALFAAVPTTARGAEAPLRTLAPDASFTETIEPHPLPTCRLVFF